MELSNSQEKGGHLVSLGIRSTEKKRMEEREREGGGKIRALIEKATGTPAPEVDARFLKAIKYVVRYSDSELQLAAKTLMDLMKTNNSEVRYLSLLIIDELFMRSKLFRSIIVASLDRLLSLSIGFRGVLPAPEAGAAKLRSKGIEFLEKWNIAYGLHYRQIRLGFDYLKNTLRYQFPNIQANAERMERERIEREMRTKEILRKKYEQLKTDFPSIKKDIQNTIDEIGECLEILRVEQNSVPSEQLDDEDEEVEFRASGLLQLRLEALKEGEKIHENNDNKVVADALRESYRVLVTRHLASVQKWTSMLVRVEVTDDRCRETMLKEFIDIRNLILSTQKKCEKSGCSLSDTVYHEEGEILWEEGGTEAVDDRASGKKPVKNVEVNDGIRSKHEAPSSSKMSKESRDIECNLDPVKQKLLAEAPVIKLGSFHNWSSNDDVMANYRGLDLQSHWGRVDQDAVIPAHRIAELNFLATVYEEEPVEIQPCRAPLKKGGLCPRRDLKICPFHGPIIPRDSEGKPTNTIRFPDDMPGHQTSELDDKSFDSKNEIVEQLAKQAIKNVRHRAEEEMKNKKAIKRAKLLKVREHNKAVLREAALASTSSSAFIGEDLEMANGGNSASENNGQSIASIQRSKTPTKARIADKLRNLRSRNATVNCHKLRMHQ
uniref:UV-stimulated scaffold protein A C-terminal domain-containing protein n=1 Tax=Kalanchoe fedtschenkoi TaxID=63787 RepID=A0A7N0T468_KALFE